MPFICLANANVPNGVLQITDLWPNESQRNGAIDPPGQNRYLNRPATDLVAVVNGVVQGLRADAGKSVLEGLGAYLADRVAPGGTEQATGTVQMVGPLAGDTLTFTGPDGVSTRVFTAVTRTPTGSITVGTPTAAVGRLTLGGVPLNCVEDAAQGTVTILAGCVAGDTVSIAGVVFTAVAGGANPANQQFNDVASAGSAILSADSLRTAINDAASQALITAALDALTPVPVGGTITPDAPGAAAIALTASVPGVWGDAALAENTAGARVTVSGATMVHIDPNPANQEFGSAAHYSGQVSPAEFVAADIAATVNDAATIALMDAANAGPVPTADFGHMTAVAALTVVTLTASQTGFSGQLDLATTEPVQLVLSDVALGNFLADPTNFEFDSLLNASTNVLAATSLVACLNNAVTDVALGTTLGGSTVTAANGGGALDTVTITADTAGPTGAMDITPSNAVRLAVSADALATTMGTWTTVQINAAAVAIQNLVDTGAAATEAAINGAINGVAGVSGVDIVHASSTSALSDILSILAGRVYQMDAGVTKDPTGKNWDTSAAGAFTTPNTVFDTDMDHGEWRPAARWIKHGKERQAVVSGGDVVNNENGGIRTTVNSTHFQSSLATGQLAHYAAGITLFPDADVQAFVSDWTRRTNRQATLNNQRVVTVYDDDGTVLA